MVKRQAGPAVLNRPPPFQNHLLAALPVDVLSRLSPTLRILALDVPHVLHRPGDPIRHVYFPGGGFCSLLAVLDDGRMVEVATVGSEGMVGLNALADSRPAGMAMVQARIDPCYELPIDAFRAEIDRRGVFLARVTRFHDALVGFIMQSAACNAIHTVEQRLSRWLLLAHDRVGKDDFPLTQEFAAMMLGSSRPAVTVVAGTLQKAGLIHYHRGHLRILDRKGLESASCECYAVATAILAAAAAR